MYATWERNMLLYTDVGDFNEIGGEPFIKKKMVRVIFMYQAHKNIPMSQCDLL